MYYVWILISTFLGLVMTNARTVLLSPVGNVPEYNDDDMPPPWKEQFYHKPNYLQSESDMDEDTDEADKLEFVSPERVARQLVWVTVQRPLLIVQGTPTRYHKLTTENKIDQDLISNHKRSLALLARWGPFNELGKESVRSAGRIRSLMGSYGDIVSAETRARPAGQPLRWG